MLTKEQKQKNFFKSICEIAKDSKVFESKATGVKYHDIKLMISPENLEEIREWSE